MMPNEDTCSTWQWLSTPPGSTSLPRASIVAIVYSEANATPNDFDGPAPAVYLKLEPGSVLVTGP
jgi:hypothetical protein